MERTINKELDAAGLLRIRIEGVSIMSGGPVLTWTTPYDDNVNEYINEIDKTWEIVSKHYENWKKKSTSPLP